METKRCRKCGAEKPHTFFYSYPRNRDGLHSYCKECQHAQSRARYANNVEERRAWNRAYARSERGKATRRRYDEARGRQARQARQRERYQADSEYREKTQARNRRLSRERWHASPHAAKVHNYYWRARQHGVAGTWTARDWEELCAHYGNRCLACGSAGPLTVDHVIPLEKGGTNDISNIQPLCGPCNRRKGTRIIDYRTVAQLELFGDE